jgi:RNA binding exosome subunit
VESGLMKSQISYIDISFFAHATEDQNKVLTAVKNILPRNYADKISFSKSNLRGEYGNPIIFFKTQLREPEITELLLSNISLNLPAIDKEDLHRNLSLHLSGGSLYIRLDKQEAFKGRFKLCRADPIRIHIKFKTSKLEEIRKICQVIGLLP